MAKYIEIIGGRQGVKKRVCIGLNFIALVPSRLIRQMLAILFGVEF